MAQIKKRGNAYNVVFTYKGDNNKTKHHWESYSDELEATSRKAYIDLLQARKDIDAIRQEVFNYKKKRADIESAKQITISDNNITINQDNMLKTFSEFKETFLPIYGRKKKLAPSTYSGMEQIFDRHILPYFGNMIMNNITVQHIDQFIDHISKKKCAGQVARNRTSKEIPTLSSATVRKIYSTLYIGLGVAKEWGYIEEVPKTDAPSMEYRKRTAWSKDQVYDVLEQLDDELLHLAVHLIFICSLRSGEALGLQVKSINLDKKYIDIKQTLDRVPIDAIEEISTNDIYKVFPALVEQSKTCMVLKKPKTDASNRRIYLTDTLVEEIKTRLFRIQQNKEQYPHEYNDYGLLFCGYNGNPIETKLLNKWFKKWQRENAIDPVIEIQGLRKSSSMYKLRLTGYNYQEVQMDTGHTTPKVLMKHYDEVLDSERVGLANKIQGDFYSPSSISTKLDADAPPNDTEKIFAEVQNNPEFAKFLLTTFQQMHSMQ